MMAHPGLVAFGPDRPPPVVGLHSHAVPPLLPTKRKQGVQVSGKIIGGGLVCALLLFGIVGAFFFDWISPSSGGSDRAATIAAFEGAEAIIDSAATMSHDAKIELVANGRAAEVLQSIREAKRALQDKANDLRSLITRKVDPKVAEYAQAMAKLRDSAVDSLDLEYERFEKYSRAAEQYRAGAITQESMESIVQEVNRQDLESQADFAQKAAACIALRDLTLAYLKSVYNYEGRN